MKLTHLMAAASVAALGTAAQAQETTLALSHWLPPTHPLQTTGMEMWIDAIEEASGGGIAIEIYPAQQLGAAPDHYDMARDGIVDISFINPGYQPGRFPIISAGELPFHIDNAKAGSRAFHEWYQPYAEQEMSDVTVCLVHLHDPGTLHGKEGQLLVPSDIDGKNVRPANGTTARMVNLMGGASVQVPAPEMREALSKGTADITASPWGSLFTFGAQDLVQSHLDVPLYVTVFAFLINTDSLNAMSEENRQVMMDHCTPEWSEKIASGWADAEAEGRQQIIDLGHDLYAPDDAQLQEWKDATAPLVDEWKQTVTDAGIEDADAAYDAFVQKIRDADSMVE
ncbi:TRAP transporter substrate-binding protein [Mesobaculum littorinae]|uniref:TRAP transporter substrate-binding protein n=1 Tax=Mesobaculum littorinae TaxID=2486419 RepID=A0A438AHB3_9RHOB|nr:TRAP transporter substrate-binding protein [Mesobaculum littorinae]RVV98113.1 TRAP transporter substrate-binding protein [Mesobaculum littorinae]